MINSKFDPATASGGLAFILPAYGAYCYAHRCMATLFKYTPIELNPVCLFVDDASPEHEKQDWDYFYEDLPRVRCWHRHFPANAGLTRSWNVGLDFARELGCRWVVAGNSDVLFTPHWHEGLIHQLEHGAHLVGPVTNAPGWTPKQDVSNYFPNYRVTDDPEYLAQVAEHLYKSIKPRVIQRVNPLKNVMINGFFMMAKTDVWWLGAFNKEHVFDPRRRMDHNEDELEIRWVREDRRIGFVPSSFIFHYRAVSRGDRWRRKGWHRLDNMWKPV